MPGFHNYKIGKTVFIIYYAFFCVGVMYSLRWIWCLWCYSECIPKVVGSIPTMARHIFQACPVWIYTQSNITSIILRFIAHYLAIRSYILGKAILFQEIVRDFIALRPLSSWGSGPKCPFSQRPWAKVPSSHSTVASSLRKLRYIPALTRSNA
jgi:hypothetical protein